jgi:hypothetical protein
LFPILPRLWLNPSEVFGHGACAPILLRWPFSQRQSCLPVIDPTGQENYGNFFWDFSLCGHAYRNLKNSKFYNSREIRSFRRLEGSKEYFSFFRQANNEQLNPRN